MGEGWGELLYKVARIIWMAPKIEKIQAKFTTFLN